MIKHTITTISSEDDVVVAEIPIYNTFEAHDNRPWLAKNSVYFLALVVIFTFIFTLTFDWEKLMASDIDQKYNKMAVTVVDLGDFVSFRQRFSSGGRRVVEIDDVFGNKYVKDKKKKYDADSDDVTTDPRIASAGNYIPGQATQPIDLTPWVQPQYPSRARGLGIEGMVILELIIGDEGKVLRARPVKSLHPILDAAAVRTYMRKKYKPSINNSGKRITVKLYQPVRFQLL
mgnify:CR=1 FL=1